MWPGERLPGPSRVHLAGDAVTHAVTRDGEAITLTIALGSGADVGVRLEDHPGLGEGRVARWVPNLRRPFVHSQVTVRPPR